MLVRVLALATIGLLSAGCYLAHERPEPAVDAAVIDAHDAARVRPDAPDAPFCPPGMSCDCFVGGDVTWGGVLYLVPDSTTVEGWAEPGRGWGDDIHIDALCPGTYTITAHVVSRGPSRCEIATVQTITAITRPRSGARARMPTFISNDACASEALTMTGGETCLSVAWTANGGGTGSTDLGCFAGFGPYCFGGPGCGAGGMGVGASGDWTF